VVNTASISGHLPAARLGVYTASKFAVVGLTESLRLELADSAIGVSVLCPGIVKTALLETSQRHRPERHGTGTAELSEGMEAVIEIGSDPALVGDRVVEAIKAEEFYIFTHPQMRPAFESRFEGILSAQEG
jgi:short-subunit dehydrogenase